VITTFEAAPGIDTLTTNVTIPGFGTIPINAFVVHGSEPVLVDTGPVLLASDFMTTLRTVIDPTDLRWIWLTHTDYDHVGALPTLLAENPNLRVITSFVGVGIMGLANPLPMDRVYLINPGQTLELSDRRLTAIKPPVYDNPVTTGFHDDATATFFSSDCFGALLEAVPQSATDLSAEQLRQGQVFWATVDSPWVQKVDTALFAKELNNIREMDARLILSSHLPPAPGSMTEQLLGSLAAAPDAQPFVGPDQVALDQMLADMAGAPD
jgi:flavorubredoxin